LTRAGPSAVTILVLAALALAPPRPASADEALVDLLRAGGRRGHREGDPGRAGPLAFEAERPATGNLVLLSHSWSSRRSAAAASASRVQ